MSRDVATKGLSLAYTATAHVISFLHFSILKKMRRDSLRKTVEICTNCGNTTEATTVLQQFIRKEWKE